LAHSPFASQTLRFSRAHLPWREQFGFCGWMYRGFLGGLIRAKRKAL
jgi:hypothetical protein